SSCSTPRARLRSRLPRRAEPVRPARHANPNRWPGRRIAGAASGLVRYCSRVHGTAVRDEIRLQRSKETTRGLAGSTRDGARGLPGAFCVARGIAEETTAMDGGLPGFT